MALVSSDFMAWFRSPAAFIALDAVDPIADFISEAPFLIDARAAATSLSLPMPAAFAAVEATLPTAPAALVIGLTAVEAADLTDAIAAFCFSSSLPSLPRPAAVAAVCIALLAALAVFVIGLTAAEAAAPIESRAACFLSLSLPSSPIPAAVAAVLAALVAAAVAAVLAAPIFVLALLAAPFAALPAAPMDFLALDPACNIFPVVDLLTLRLPLFAASTILARPAASVFFIAALFSEAERAVSTPSSFIDLARELRAALIAAIAKLSPAYFEPFDDFTAAISLSLRPRALPALSIASFLAFSKAFFCSG